VAPRKKKNPSVLFDRRSLPRVPAITPGWDPFYFGRLFCILSGAWRRMAHVSVLAAGPVDVKAKHAVGFTFAACPALQRSIPARRQCSEVDLPI
jgi:hypothetical protein